MEHELPLACVGRIVKDETKANTTKEVKEQFNKAAGIFILYLTEAANEKAGKQITLNDVYAALESTRFKSFKSEIEEFMTDAKKTKATKRKASDTPLTDNTNKKTST